MRLVSFNREGDNIYDNTLGDSVIEGPAHQGETLWEWAGPVPLPPPDFPDGPTGARRVGVEIPPGLAIEAFRGPAIAGEFCQVDVLGGGILTCGPWIEAAIQEYIQCRGNVLQHIDCHGLNFVVLPFIIVKGIGRPSAQDAMTVKQSTFLFTSHLYLYRADDGWRYKALTPLDFYQPKFPALEERTSYGPFAEPEEAARDAVVTLKLPRGSWYAGLADMCEPKSDLARAAATLKELLDSPQWAPPPKLEVDDASEP